jgi:hypothetical protein
VQGRVPPQVTQCGAGGARTHDRQIMRSTLVRNTRLTSNDAPRGCQERTRGTGSTTGCGPRPGPRREAPSRATTVTQRKRSGMGITRGPPSISPIMRSNGSGPCQLVLSAWESARSGLLLGLTCRARCPRGTARSLNRASKSRSTNRSCGNDRPPVRWGWYLAGGPLGVVP